MSAPDIPPPPPPPAPPPTNIPKIAEESKTVRQTQPKKRKRGAQAQLKRSRPTLGGSAGGTGVYMSS